MEKQWARWIYVVLYYLGGLGALFSIITLPPRYYLAIGAMLFMGVFYVGSATYLAFIRRWK